MNVFMNKTFLKIAYSLLAIGFMAQGLMAVEPKRVLSDHTPKIVSQLTPLIALNATNELRLAISLPLRNQDGLNSLLQQIYDPSSPNFHRFLTPQKFTAQFGATESDYRALKSFAQASGFRIVAEHPNRLILDVAAPAGKIEKAFGVKFNKYRDSKRNRDFYASDTAPAVDASLPILSISGLNDYYVPRPHSHVTPLSKVPKNLQPSGGSGPQGTYIGSDFRKAYVPGTTLTGAGQNVGLLQFDGFFPTDPAAYAKMIGLSNPPNLVVVPVDGGVPIPGGGNEEVCLDIEMTMAMAPGVSNIYVYEAPNPSPWVDLLSRMANDNLAKQLSCSWGGGPPLDSASEQIFQQMALQGQTFFNAVGDTDAFHDPDNPITFPSDSPNVCNVGGTTLTTDNSGNFVSEQVWNWRTPNPNGGNWGSCGGISDTFAIPTWQTGINMTNNHGSTSMRNTPDVALTADNVFLIADNGLSGASGGTSAASPLWAAFISLVNQQGATNNDASVGFLNPTVYALAKTTNYNKGFRDVTAGDNFWPSSPTNFPAVAGYDLATGLGSPNGTNLINLLAPIGGGGGGNVTVPISTPTSWNNNLLVMNGSNPNGDWFLFVQDDKVLDVGTINSGWAVTLTTANPVGNAADQQVVLTPSATSLITNSSWALTLTATNYGPSASTNVLVTLTLPGAGVPLLSSNLTAGSAQVIGTTLTWTLGNLGLNSGAAMTLNFLAATPGTYTSTASVNATTPDPNSDDDTSTATLTVSGVMTPPVLAPAVAGSGGLLHLSVTGSAGQSAIIQSSTNLVNWIPVYTNLIPFTFTNLESTNLPACFYRAVVGQ
jgi:subtilase family serine protease